MAFMGVKLAAIAGHRIDCARIAILFHFAEEKT
jgi:hypothetical protein